MGNFANYNDACYAIQFCNCHTLISNASPTLAKNNVNAKQQAEAELFLFENCLYSSSTLSSKNDSTYSKTHAKEEVCL